MPETPQDSGNLPVRSLRRRSIAPKLAILIMLVLLAGCGGDQQTNPPASGPHVVIVGNPLGNPDSLFRPETLDIRVGQTVTWTDHDDQSHTVTPDVNYPDWSGGSDVLSHGRSYQHQFTRAGTYRYYCTVHANMIGTIVVRG